MRRLIATLMALTLCLAPAIAQDAPTAPPEMKVSGDGYAVTMTGPIGRGTAAAFAQILDQVPQLRLLRLQSPGGLVGEARGVAKLVQMNGLDTYAAGMCASACTMIFYAGQKRWLGPEVRMGFHSYSSAKNHPASDEQIAAAEDVERRSYGKGGLSHWFTEKMFATPNNALWIPSVNEMLAARFATDVTVEEYPVHPPQQAGLPSVNPPMMNAAQLPNVITP